MLSHPPFYFGTIRKTVVAFGSLFTNIQVVRVDASGTPIQTIQVPLTYGPKEKYLVRLKQDPMPSTGDQVEMVLPRCSYELRGMVYDETRKLTSTGYTAAQKFTGDNTGLQSQYNPVPYNITFEFNIMTKTIEDGLQILEQIIPFFTPDYVVRVADVPSLELQKDISFVLSGITSEDTYDGTFQERRTITFTLMFVAKAYIYPPVEIKKVILTAITNLRVAEVDLITGLPINELAVIGTSKIEPPTAQPTDQFTILDTIQSLIP